MGVLFAQAARLRGAKVKLIHGPLQTPNGLLDGLETYPIKSGAQLQMKLAELQPCADVVAMTSAVTDIKMKDGGKTEKLEKKTLLKSLETELEEVPDLLQQIASQRPKGQTILGFAALTGDDNKIKQIGEAKRQKKGCDLLMANPIDRPGQGLDEDLNGGWLLADGGKILEIPVKSKLALAHQLLDAIHELRN